MGDVSIHRLIAGVGVVKSFEYRKRSERRYYIHRKHRTLLDAICVDYQCRERTYWENVDLLRDERLALAPCLCRVCVPSSRVSRQHHGSTTSEGCYTHRPTRAQDQQCRPGAMVGGTYGWEQSVLPHHWIGMFREREVATVRAIV